MKACRPPEQEPENADLAVCDRTARVSTSDCGLGIADHLGVGNAAVGAHFGGDVVRVTLARALIEVSADREIAVMREPTASISMDCASARKMVDKRHARKGARTRRLGHIGGNRGPLVAFDGHVLAGHASIEQHQSSSIGFSLSPSVGASQRRAIFKKRRRAPSAPRS